MWGWETIAGIPFRGGGIRRRLLIWGLSLSGISLISVILAGYFYTVRQIKRDAAELQTEIASVTARRIDAFINRKIERLSDAAVAMSLYRLGSGEQQLLINLLVKNDTSFTEASVLDAKGMEVVKVSDRRVYLPSEFSDQSKSAKFNQTIKGGIYISPVYTSDRAKPYVTLAVPLRNDPQDIVGVACAEANLDVLWEVIGQVHFGTEGYAYLVDGQGNLIAHKNPSLVLSKTNLRRIHKVQEFIRNPTLPDPAPAHEEQGIMDRAVLSTYALVPRLGWAVILEEPLDAALINVKTLERYALLVLVIGLLVGAAVIGWVSSRITEPVRELHRGAKIIGTGNLNHRVAVKTGDEIEWLAEEFNKMAGELKVSYSTLEQKVEQRTDELEKANLELQEANHVKSEFMAAMSHELRTPLTVMIGNVELIKDGFFGGITEQQEIALSKVTRNGKVLLKLISDVLTLSRLEAKRNIEISTCQVDEILRHVQEYGEQLRRNGYVTMLWKVQPNLPPMTTDVLKLEEILQNLIGNAFKFTPKGKIEIRVRDVRDKNRIEFAVADTGMGIEEKDLEKIFDEFHQLKEAHTGNFSGVGLGLSIVKKYLDLMQGDIRVESSPEVGSTFTFTLPYSYNPGEDEHGRS